MTASQRAKQKCATKQNKPAQTSEAANCCCMVAPWEITEQDRKYILKVTKVGKGKGLNNSEIDVSEKLEPSNKEKNSYELHIVAPPVDKDGKVTYKKITSNHKFLKKECDLKMLVKRDKFELAITEGGNFEIDSNGGIRGEKNTNCEIAAEREIKKQEASTKYVKDYQKANKAYEDQVKAVETNIKIMKEQHTAPNVIATYEKATSNEVLEKIRDDRISELVKDLETEVARIDSEQSYMEAEYSEDKIDKSFLSDYEIILRSIFNPKSVSEKVTILPTGSIKCNSQPKVDLYVLPFTKYSGTVRIKYSTAKNQPVDKRSIRTFNKTTSGWEFSVNLKGQYGTHIFNLSPIEIEKKGETSKQEYDKKEKKKAQKLDKKLGRSESHLLGKIEKVMYYFTKADKENKKYFEKLKEKSTEEAQACAKHYPVFSFDPGTTGIMLGVTGYETQEYPSNYMVGKKYNVTLKLNILTGANIKVDILSLLITRAGGKARKLLSSIRLEACKGWHGIRGEIVVEMSLIGGGAMKFDLKQELSQPLEVYGNGSVKLGLIAKVSAKAEADIWLVTVSGEISGTMASAINQAVPAGYEFTLGYFPNKNDGCWKAGFIGSGLALYYVLKGSVGIKKDDSTDNTIDDGFGYSASGQASDHYTIFPADKPKNMDCIDLSKYLT